MWTARILPLICMGGALLWMFLTGRSLSIDDILNYTPSQPFLAVLFLWIAFALKSLTLVFPVLLLFAVSGQLFPLPVALIVSIVGITITLTIPYFIGRASELDFSDRLMARYPKLQEIRCIRNKNEFFFSFLSRAVGVLPCDVLSMYFGSTRLRFSSYITGAVLGFMPDTVCATILGQKITDIHSVGFLITLSVNIIACIASYFLFLWYKRKSLSGTSQVRE